MVNKQFLSKNSFPLPLLTCNECYVHFLVPLLEFFWKNIRKKPITTGNRRHRKAEDLRSPVLGSQAELGSTCPDTTTQSYASVGVHFKNNKKQKTKKKKTQFFSFSHYFQNSLGGHLTKILICNEAFETDMTRFP